MAQGKDTAIGRIVHYVLSERDVQRAYKTRNETGSPSEGNAIEVGHTYPMMIVHVPKDDEAEVNGQVFLDGNDSIWVTSRRYSQGGEQATWHWHDDVVAAAAPAETPQPQTQPDPAAGDATVISEPNIHANPADVNDQANG